LDFSDEKCASIGPFKGRHVVSFTKCILQQEMQSGKMCFTSWSEFKEEFTSAFCPENKATTALMWLESDRYFQGKQNIEVYIDKFKDLINLSGYTNPITFVLKFHRGSNLTTQDRIAESGMDRLEDIDFNGWFKARLSVIPLEVPLLTLYPHQQCTPLPCALYSPSSAHTHPPLLLPLQQCTPLRVHFPLAF
jgi:hypothetical protein